MSVSSSSWVMYAGGESFDWFGNGFGVAFVNNSRSRWYCAMIFFFLIGAGGGCEVLLSRVRMRCRAFGDSSKIGGIGWFLRVTRWCVSGCVHITDGSVVL